MYTRRHLRHATRWNRRLAFAAVMLLLLGFGWRAYRAWQLAYPLAREPLGKVIY